MLLALQVDADEDNMRSKSSLVTLLPSNLLALTLDSAIFDWEELAHLTNLTELHCRMQCYMEEDELPLLPSLRDLEHNGSDVRKLYLGENAPSLTSLRVPCFGDLDQTFMACLYPLVTLTKLVIDVKVNGVVKSTELTLLPPKLAEFHIIGRASNFGFGASDSQFELSNFPGTTSIVRREYPISRSIEVHCKNSQPC